MGHRQIFPILKPPGIIRELVNRNSVAEGWNRTTKTNCSQKNKKKIVKNFQSMINVNIMCTFNK